MATSAWGDSWLNAWGGAWGYTAGAAASVAPTVTPGKRWLFGPPRTKRNLREPKDGGEVVGLDSLMPAPEAQEQAPPPEPAPVAAGPLPYVTPLADRGFESLQSQPSQYQAPQQQQPPPQQQQPPPPPPQRVNLRELAMRAAAAVPPPRQWNPEQNEMEVQQMTQMAMQALEI